MTHGGAGALLPVVVYLVLCVPVLVIWLARGPGSKAKRVAVASALIGAQAICVASVFTLNQGIQNLGFALSIALGFATLLAPAIFKGYVCNGMS